MLNRIKPKSEFSKNVLTLMTGTTIAQAIPIAISPILTRIYTPEDFGLLALFMSIMIIFGSIVTGRYELAIMIPRKDEDAINISALAFIITTIISLFLVCIVFFFNDFFAALLGNKKIEIWLYFVPLTVFLTGVFNILVYFNNRKKNYIDLAKANVLKSIVLAIIQLTFGYLKNGVFGLITGQIISQFFANTKLLKNIIKDKVLLSKISKIKIIALGKKYSNFPKYLVLAHGINSLSGQSHIILFSTFFNISIVGFLSFAQKLLGMPMSLIARSIGDVFRQEASIYYNKNKECLTIYKSTFKKLFFISVFPFILLFIMAPSIFSFVFGKDWIIAGNYAQVLVPMYFLQFITTPLSNMYLVAEKQKLDLYWQIYLLFTVVLSILVGYYIFNDSYITIILFSLSYSVAYIINICFSYNFAKGK
jgi:O-antigen/teichoic acid export membrane protein